MIIFNQTFLILVTWLLLLMKCSKSSVLSTSRISLEHGSSNYSAVGSANDINIKKLWNNTTEINTSQASNHSTKLSKKLGIRLNDTADMISDYVTNVHDVSVVSRPKENEKNEGVNSNVSDKNEIVTIRNSQDLHKSNLSSSECSQENAGVNMQEESASRICNITFIPKLQISSDNNLIKRILVSSIRNNYDISNNFSRTLQFQPMNYNNGSSENTRLNKNKQNSPKISYSSNSNTTFSTSPKDIQPNTSNLLGPSTHFNYSSSIYATNLFPEDEKQVNINVSTIKHLTENVFLSTTTVMSELRNNGTFEEIYAPAKKDTQLKSSNRKYHHMQKPKYIRSKAPKRAVRGHLSPKNTLSGIHVIPNIFDPQGGLVQNDEAANFGRSDESETSLERESLQNTKDILRQWLESSIIDLSEDQDEFHDSGEGWDVTYDDHHPHEWQNDYDIIDEIFHQDWSLNSDELSDWFESQENEYFACIASDLWEHFMSFGNHIYKGCEFTSESEQAELGFRLRRFISRAPGGRVANRLAPAKCKKGTKRVKRVCRKVWYS